MHLSKATAEQWLSNPRLHVYLHATSGDLTGALDLYDWNAEVAAACLRDVGHFEVLIRNRYAAALTHHHPDWTYPSNIMWTLEAGIPPTRVKQQKLNKGSMNAVRTARNKTTPPSAGHTIANLPFGFWMMLTAGAREDTVWTPMLSPLFPGSARGDVHDPMEKLNNFRNRLAHWEPVFSTTTGLAARLEEFDRFFTSVDSDVAAWVGERSNVVRTVAQCPVPGLHIAAPSYLSSVP
nr:hypothetical protein [Microbacterium lemovicicum]